MGSSFKDLVTTKPAMKTYVNLIYGLRDKTLQNIKLLIEIYMAACMKIEE